MEEEKQDKTPAGRAEESKVNSVLCLLCACWNRELRESGNETKVNVRC